MSDAPPPTSLVALRDRRESAIQLLTDAFANDLLPMEEFDSRLSRAHAATRLDELDGLVADLAPAAPGKSTSLAPIAVDASLVPSKKSIRTVFGNLERRGAWVVPDKLAVGATFGNAVLDFREARFAAATVEIDARITFGNLEIIVPPHLAVECEGSTIFGNFESQASGGVGDPDRPILRIGGRVVFGNVEVFVRLPGESERDARRRRKRERKALAGREANPAAAVSARREDRDALPAQGEQPRALPARSEK